MEYMCLINLLDEEIAKQQSKRVSSAKPKRPVSSTPDKIAERNQPIINKPMPV